MNQANLRNGLRNMLNLNDYSPNERWLIRVNYRFDRSYKPRNIARLNSMYLMTYLNNRNYSFGNNVNPNPCT